MKKENSQIRDVPEEEVEILGSWYLFGFHVDSVECYLKWKLSSSYKIVATHSPESEVTMNNVIRVFGWRGKDAINSH